LVRLVVLNYRYGRKFYQHIILSKETKNISICTAAAVKFVYFLTLTLFLRVQNPMASLQLVGDNIAGNILRLASGGRVDNLNLNAMSIFLEAATEAPAASPSKAQAVVASRKCFTDSSNHKSH
jgi:hypothetical protein